MIKLKINTKTQNYPILIGKGLVPKISTLLKKNSIKFSKCLLIVDNKIPNSFQKKIINSISKKKNKSYLFQCKRKK